jgi:hypothetical protein
LLLATAIGVASTGLLRAQTVSVDALKSGSLGNETISAEWQLQDGRLSGVIVRAQTDRTAKSDAALKFDEPFSLALRDGSVIHANDLVVDGAPHVEHFNPDAAAARYSERLPGIAIHYALKDSAGRFTADWAIILREGSPYIRQSLTITAGAKPVDLSDVALVDLRSSTATLAGVVKGSPLVDGNFFLGFEHPLSQCGVVAGRATCDLQSGVPIGAGQSVEYSSVVGIAPPGQMRRAFLNYIERERAHPYRTFLHYNSWFDIGFFTPYTQQDAVTRIHEIGNELNKKRGVTLDSFLFDDGWDNYHDLWKIRADFKDGFAPLKDAAAKYGTAPGVWLSPWGGYGPAKKERVAAATKDGYEIVDGGLALSGPKYYARFHEAVTEMVTKYGVNQFKFDGTGNADRVVKGSQFSSDFDAAIHLIGDLRKLKPDIFINLTTGTYPSPFWLMDADSIWRGGEDTDFAGVGTDRERWITYRDADTYDEVVKAGRLYPLNSLMLHGIVYAKQAPHLSTASEEDFRNEVRSYFGSGTQLQELYITPSLLTTANWETLAEAAKWSRANASVLVDAHWVGGDPRWLEVYGWAAWSPAKAILTLRNPSDKEQDFTLDVASAFELPADAVRVYRAKSPWLADASRAVIELRAGEGHTFHLGAFEVMTLEAIPRESQ